jgi:hypothetical protein
MYYVTYDKPKSISDELIDAAVQFAAEFLNLDGSIEIDFGDKFEKDKCGYCDYDEEGVTIFINPKMKPSKIIVTLFHEMVHARQFMRGWLEIPDKNSLPARWFGKEYDVPYFESPWEIEAYELELVMWDIFNERNS